VKIEDMKELSMKEIEVEIGKSQNELLQLNLRRKQLDKSHHLGICRKNIARLKTILRQKSLKKEGVK
jgi:ribosomal protein L29